ncbi:MAG: biotin--[acetyl-CoA-carboxylase] ligase [Chloroflexi bacterium]|nr:biotin--[acetyl-CoA-carboxylase] ligase [Chloroflexota bacterium]
MSQDVHKGATALSVGEILKRLATVRIGRALEHYQVIDSTNRRAFEWAQEGAPDGSVVIAEEQTSGRGRLGRRWEAPAGAALLCSIVLRPTLTPAQAQRVTMITSLAAVEAIHRVANVRAEIKWPNDLVIAERKVGGILTELAMAGRNLGAVIVGVGINVTLDPAQLSEVRVPATSLWAEVGTGVCRQALLCEFLQGVDDRYQAMQAGWSPLEEWRSHLATLGTAVDVGTTEDVIRGIATDVDGDGALIVREATGVVHRILAGDVTLRGHRV